MNLIYDAVRYLSGNKDRLRRYFIPEFEDEGFEEAMDFGLTTCGTNANIFYSYINNILPVYLVNIFWAPTDRGVFIGHGFNLFFSEGKKVLLIHSYYNKFPLRVDIAPSLQISSFLYNLYLLKKTLIFSKGFCEDYAALFGENINLEGAEPIGGIQINISAELASLCILAFVHSYIDMNHALVISYLGGEG